MKLRLVLVSAILLLPLTLSAEQAEEQNPWAGKATLGYLATSGNTQNATLNTGMELSYSTANWTHLAKAFAISASESRMTTAEAYELGWKSERKLTGHDFLFARVQWQKDGFGAYAIQFSQSVGYGRRFIDSDKHKLNAELGFGARQSELQTGARESETIFRSGADYKWLFNKTAEFRQELAVEAGDKNTYFEAKTSLSAKLFGDLALVASYTIKHNTDVPPLTEKTDTYTALSLEYAF